jgi:hypothetical protein
MSRLFALVIGAGVPSRMHEMPYSNRLVKMGKAGFGRQFLAEHQSLGLIPLTTKSQHCPHLVEAARRWLAR